MQVFGGAVARLRFAFLLAHARCVLRLRLNLQRGEQALSDDLTVNMAPQTTHFFAEARGFGFCLYQALTTARRRSWRQCAEHVFIDARASNSIPQTTQFFSAITASLL